MRLSNLAWSTAYVLPTHTQKRCIAEAGTGSRWSRAASKVLAPSTIPPATDGEAVQARLRRQANARKTLLSGALLGHARCLLCLLEMSSMQRNKPSKNSRGLGRICDKSCPQDLRPIPCMQLSTVQIMS